MIIKVYKYYVSQMSLNLKYFMYFVMFTSILSPVILIALKIDVMTGSCSNEGLECALILLLLELTWISLIMFIADFTRFWNSRSIY